MRVAASPQNFARTGTDLAGGVVRLNHSKAVASAQLAAANKLLDVAATLSGPALKMIENAGVGIEAHGQALAEFASGLGGQVDVYA